MYLLQSAFVTSSTQRPGMSSLQRAHTHSSPRKEESLATFVDGVKLVLQIAAIGVEWASKCRGAQRIFLAQLTNLFAAHLMPNQAVIVSSVGCMRNEK
jgi:hypothetical protein